MKILIVEDEISLSESISAFLESAGFTTETARSCFEAEDKILGFTYDLIILDIMLPDGSGMDLLDIIKKEHSQTAVMIISARNALDDKIKGLDLGADDYITKPFHFSELNARINAILRRRNFEGNDLINFQEISIDTKARRVSIHNNSLELTSREFNLLLYFIINKNRVVTKAAIAEHLWGDEMDLADSHDFIYTHIKNLRKKIIRAGGNDYLTTVYGLGYRFNE
jgi:DNA-binding response OmpR family regulator